MDEGGTPLLPDSLIYQIFLSLGPADVLAAGLVCRRWQAVSRDEFLWREQFYRYYQVARDVPRHPGQGLHVAPQSTRLAGRAGGRAVHMLPAEAAALVPEAPCGPHADGEQRGLAGRRRLGGAGGTPAAEVTSSRGRAGPSAVRVLASMGKEAQGPGGDHPPPLAATSWYEEFRRLYDTVPCVEVQTLKEHTDQVLHLSFSHSGYQFASCSKDCTVKVSPAHGSWGRGRGVALSADGGKRVLLQSQEPATWTRTPRVSGQPGARSTSLVVVSGHEPSQERGLQHGPWGPVQGGLMVPPDDSAPTQIWSNDLTISLLHSADMRPYNWSYTQFSQFNQDDSLLLASGVFLGPHNSSSGEIAVISLGESGPGAGWLSWPTPALLLQSPAPPQPLPAPSHSPVPTLPRQLRPAVPSAQQAL